MLKFYLKHYLCLLVGLLLMSGGVALGKISGLGTSPISSVPNVVSIITPLTIGQATIIFMALMIFLEAVILGKKFSWQNVAQLIPSLFFGGMIDFFVALFAPIKPHNYLTCLLLVLLATAILAGGVFLEVNSGVIMMAGEGIVAAVAYRFQKKFSVLKIYNDVILITMAVVLALIFTKQLSGVREGTLITALLTGKFIELIDRFFPRLLAWVHQ
jgi:uncharacterized membrane protein YczE